MVWVYWIRMSLVAAAAAWHGFSWNDNDAVLHAPSLPSKSICNNNIAMGFGFRALVPSRRRPDIISNRINSRSRHRDSRRRLIPSPASHSHSRTSAKRNSHKFWTRTEVFFWLGEECSGSGGKKKGLKSLSRLNLSLSLDITIGCYLLCCKYLFYGPSFLSGDACNVIKNSIWGAYLQFQCKMLRTTVQLCTPLIHCNSIHLHPLTKLQSLLCFAMRKMEKGGNQQKCV